MNGFKKTSLLAVCLGAASVGCAGVESVAPVGQRTLAAASVHANSVYGLGDLNRTVIKPCTDAGHRQFDFWLGTWDVFSAAGNRIATSIISTAMDGCLVMEDYIQNDGYRGRSMSVYDEATGRWSQTFVDNVIAASVRLEGAAQGNAIVMASSQPVYNFATGTVRQRDETVTWTPLDGGRVNQHTLTSFNGAPVITTFNGTYVPQSALARATPHVYPFCNFVIPEFHQLDFWVGNWAVQGDGTPDVGTSQVTKDLNGCLIQEDFTSPKGYRSRSYVYFDFVVEKWFRSFADNVGNHVELSGAMSGDAIVMSGQQTSSGGHVSQVRVTLRGTALGVSQVWESSDDAGRTWHENLTLSYHL